VAGEPGLQDGSGWGGCGELPDRADPWHSFGRCWRTPRQLIQTGPACHPWFELVTGVEGMRGVKCV
jgi:hypothetical protein